ncbi:MAG: hypothetical protein ABI217_10625 [Chthoniobacterales bacterium]
MRIGILQVQAQFAAGDAGEIEQVIDEAGLELDIARDHAQSFPQIFGQIVIVQHAAGPHQDGRERGAQLAAESGEESILGGIGGFRYFLLALQLAFDVAPLDELRDLAA